MSRPSPWLITIAATVLSALLIFYSRDLSKFIVGLFIPLQTPDKISQFVLAKTGDPKEVRELHHLDQIKAPPDKPIRLIFTSGWVLDLKENSSAIVELYRPQEVNSPALLSLITGEYSLVTPGPPGQLFIMQDKKIYSPQNIPIQQTREIDINGQLPLQPIASPVGAIGKANKLPDKITNQDNSETLSNNYIEQVLVGQSNLLRNCQLNSVRDKKPAFGMLTLTFTINPDGKINNIKLLQDKIKNPQLTKCTIEVIERTHFKPFSGPAISLNYPLEYK